MKAAIIALLSLIATGWCSEAWLTAVPDETGAVFDGRCRDLEENTTIHLGPGVYYTLSGWALKPGCRVIGAGWGNTTIKQVKGRTDGGVVIGGDIRRDGFNSISDLTVDANFPEILPGLVSQQSMQGIFLYGAHNSVERVRVINFGGSWEHQKEAFGIVITGACTGATLRDVVSAKVRDCVVVGSGTYDNGIVISPGTDKAIRGALIEGCFVQDCYPRTGAGHGSAYGMYSGVLRDSTAVHCQKGYYSESVDGLTILDCQFYACKENGILSWGAKNNRNLTIAGNLIEAPLAIKLYEKEGFAMTNVRITDNTITGTIQIPTLKGRGQRLVGNTAPNSSHSIARDAICIGNRISVGGAVDSLPDRKGAWK